MRIGCHDRPTFPAESHRTEVWSTKNNQTLSAKFINQNLSAKFPPIIKLPVCWQDLAFFSDGHIYAKSMDIIFYFFYSVEANPCSTKMLYQFSTADGLILKFKWIAQNSFKDKKQQLQVNFSTLQLYNTWIWKTHLRKTKIVLEDAWSRMLRRSREKVKWWACEGMAWCTSDVLMLSAAPAPPAGDKQRHR